MAQERLGVKHQRVPGGRRQVAQMGKAVEADHVCNSLKRERQYCQVDRDTQMTAALLNNSATV